MFNTEKIKARIELREKCKTDMGLRRETLLRCAEDTLYWFDNFAWTLDPRREPSEIPLIPYDGEQREFIKYLQSLVSNPRDVFIDKPRDVGATVLITNFFLKQWLFNESFNARMGSRKEDYVDSAGDPDTLFYKIDFTLQRLPKWMQPDNWQRSHMKLTRSDSSNTITGESANISFARGGRQTMVLYDEIGFWPWAKPAWESGGDVTKTRIAMTTPPDTGKASHAWKLLSQQAGNVEVFDFDYKAIPWKDTQWLKEQKDRRSQEEFEREIHKSYSGSTVGRVYATEWKQNVEETEELEYTAGLPTFISWDFGLDSVAMIWWQKDPKTNNLYIIDAYTNENKTIDFYIPFVTGVIESGVHEYTMPELAQIRMHRKWGSSITHFGDPDVHKRSLTSKKSAFSVLRERGIYIDSKPWANRKHRDLAMKAKLLMRRLTVNSIRCEYMIECITSAKYPEKRAGSQSTTEIQKPIHDYTSHYRTAFEYFADNEPDLGKRRRIRAQKRTTKHKRYRPESIL